MTTHAHVPTFDEAVDWIETATREGVTTHPPNTFLYNVPFGLKLLTEELTTDTEHARAGGVGEMSLFRLSARTVALRHEITSVLST